MCDPATITATVAVVSMAYNMQTQEAQAEYEAGVSNYKARVAENDAQRIRNKSVEEENIKRGQTAQLLSKQRAQIGAANIELGSGTALQLQEETLTLGEADALRIRSGYEEQAQALETQAKLLKRDKPTTMSDRLKGGLKKYGSVLSPAYGTAVYGANLADKWYN